MGNFSRDTFDERKRYAAVRLQQGVPLVDADWNEKEDVRRAELRGFARALAGSGVPLGSDGFRVTPAGAPNDFAIAAGRCLVDGWDVVNDWDERGDDAGRSYTSQPLFGDDELAAAWGVAPLPALTTPGEARTDRVYLDVWEREVDPGEDPELVDPLLGVEGCVRLRREWVVRVAEGAEALPAAPAGHAFYELATLSRPADAAVVTAAEVTDRRRTGLAFVAQPQLRQLTADAFGPGYLLNPDGRPNLKVSLREAVNALLRGQFPGTPALPVTRAMGTDSLGGRCALVDHAGAVWVFWNSSRSTGGSVWYNRYDPALGRWDVDRQLSRTGSHEDLLPINVLEDGDGGIWVFWTRSPSGGSARILYNYLDPASRTWRGEAQLTAGTTAGDGEATAIIDGRGDLRVVWRRRGTAGSIWHNRYDRGTGAWTGETQISTGTADNERPAVAVDGRGDLWVVWARIDATTFKKSLVCRRHDAATGNWTGEALLTSKTQSSSEPAATVDSEGSAWVFWTSDQNGNNDIYGMRYDRAGGSWEGAQQVTTDVAADSEPMVLAGDRGELWVFWTSRPGGTALPRIMGKRYVRDTGWGNAVQLSTGAESGWSPTPVRDADGDTWIFWVLSPRGIPGDIYYRRLVAAI